jgi:hypothetical protein
MNARIFMSYTRFLPLIYVHFITWFSVACSYTQPLLAERQERNLDSLILASESY